jgi:hypothetical protein
MIEPGSVGGSHQKLYERNVIVVHSGHLIPTFHELKSACKFLLEVTQELG